MEKEKETEVVLLYKEFCEKWNISYLLHSSEIRGKRRNFQWLKMHPNQKGFFEDLNKFLTEIAVLGFGVVVSRPGYNKRYTEKYGNTKWELCRTTYPILIERVVRYLLGLGEEFKLKVIFEGASGDENRKIVEYAQLLKTEGPPFAKTDSDKYSPLTTDVYQKVISGRPKPGTKSNLFLQIADLYIYPMAKFKYDSSYLPWHILYKSVRIIDAITEPEKLCQNGIKYYCFSVE